MTYLEPRHIILIFGALCAAAALIAWALKGGDL